MKSSLLKVYFSMLIIGVARCAEFMVNTPASAVICQPLLFVWSGGIPPYFPSLLPGSQTGAAPLIIFSEQSTTSLVWIPNLSPGITLTLEIRDSRGDTAQSAPFTIMSSPNSSCINNVA